MRRPSYNFGAAGATFVALLCLVAVALALTPALLVVSAVVGVLAGLVALWCWQAGRPLRMRVEANATANWWRFLLTGAVSLALALSVALVAADNFAGWYWPWFVTLVTGVTLVGLGVPLAVAHLVWGRHNPRVNPAR